jgi:drug/metabolite transporter (DMT)-like permease
MAILFLGAFATALAFYLMSTLQAFLGATEAAIIYSLEPLFATVLAMSGLVPGIREHISSFQFLGGILILSAMLLAELGPRFLRSVRLEPGDAIG